MVLAEGWEAVEALDWQRARHLFEEVLERWPDWSEEAREALQWLEVAERELAGLDDGNPGAHAVTLWTAREAFPVGGLGGRFRRAVVMRLLRLMESGAAGGPSESPCRGEVLLEAGRPGAAVHWLGEAVGAPGARRDLRRLLGLALWASDRPMEARRQWLRFLLELGPEEALEAAAALPDPEMSRLIEAHGPERAPAQAWLAGLAPLLQEDELGDGESVGLELHRHLLGAEMNRRRGDLDGAIAHREALLHLDPELLRRYMDRLG